MSQYSHLEVDLSNENSAPTKITRLVGRDRLVLDVGCAHGHLAQVLSGQGCRVVGVERDVADAERAGAHCEEVVVADLDEPAWTERLAARRFDAIVFSDVLEHLRDPARVLREACGLLTPAGFVVASIPNVAHASVRLELLLGSFHREKLGILDETHLHFFTRDTVEELFTSCGLAVDVWECTTNELADDLVADYLARIDMEYTPALREQFHEFEALAYQFVIAARPGVAAGDRAPATVVKPLETMHETIRVFEENLGETHRTLGETHRVLAETHRALAETQGALAETQGALADMRRTCASLERAVQQLETRPENVWEPREGGLRVLQVIHQFLPRHAAGTEMYCADLSFALVRRGHAVRVLAGAPFRTDVGFGVQWEGDDAIAVEKIAASRQHRVLGRVRGFFDRFDNPEARLAIREALELQRPDVVHVQHALYLSAGLFEDCRRRGIPVIVTLHDYWFLCHRVKLRRRDGALCDGPAGGWRCAQCLNLPRPARSYLNPGAVAANVYRYAYLTRQLCKADRILAPSRYLREVFVRNGIPADRIVHCSLGTAGPPPEIAAAAASRQPSERLRFGFLGTFIHDKGAHVLIDAFNQLPAGVAELHVFGIPVDPGCLEDLQQRARHPDIHWRGPVARADRWRALGEIDVLVVPSIWYENSPLTILEAHMVGVPVIGSAAGGIPELVRDGVNGRTFPLGDAAALAACLRELLATPERLAAWRAAIVPPKTMEAHAGEIEALYHATGAGRRLAAPSA